ncbi:MAG: DUF5057 domain-containing protein, partial [Oscillospiraceae bacterium]|nr:DUF5057 domain-containing protein [Oscillospiraceae bacterium]
MTAGKKITARVCALLLILAMAAALLIALPVGTTASAASLPVIEEIKLELASRPFRILEVGDNPRLKYYTYTHANFEDLIRGTATKEERAAAIAAELGSIPVLTGSPVPYTVTPYTEAYYWEALSGSSLLTIPAESRELYGVATVNAAHTGDYSAARTYRLTSGGEIGTHVLTGGYLVAGSGAGARYYYALTDSAFAQTDLGAAVGLEASTAIYEKIDGDFVYVTTYGSLQVIIDALTSGAGFDDAAFANNYYTAPEISSIAPTDTAPIPAGGEKVYYLAGGYGYAPHADGYIVEMPDLTRFALTPGAGGHDVAFGGENAITITYDKVRYTGGFTSDDWFTRYVLDAEYGSVSYEVATAASLPENIAYYDLAVLPSDCIGDAAVAAAIANKLPVIFTGGADGVEGSALSWGGELLTTGFHTTPLDATAFKAVGDAIAYENLLRRVAGNLVPQLENRITLATSIRHILNARGERSAKPLTQVRVLEVQPRYNLGDAVGTRLTAAVVADWLSGLQIQPAAGDVRPVQAADIKITTMSTAELNGRIEDLGESYELIYFGASRAHFALTGGETNFNDDVMDGLLYYNIGDTVRTTGAILGGLLTSDYTGTGAARAIATGDAASSRNFRYPGNDISASKRDALTQFAAAGYPIVFADDLTDARVDNCTHLYDFMSANLARENLFRVSEIAARRTDLLNHISLSKPTLELSSFPAPYVNMTSPTGVSPLRYAFKISDSTDATPLTTTYDVKLYIDSDASGIYTAREDVTVDVYNSSGLVRKTGGIYGLKAGAAYTAVANLPSDVVGIIPWKLEVSKNAEGGAASGHFHGSQIGYTRIKPASGQAGNINVLQIAAYGGFPN